MHAVKSNILFSQKIGMYVNENLFWGLILYVYILQPSVRKNIPGFSDFAGNSRAQKLNKAQAKQGNITGVQCFHGICSCLRAHQREWCQLCLLSLTLSTLHFLTICAKLPFCLRLCNQQSAAPPTESPSTTNRVCRILSSEFMQKHMTKPPPPTPRQVQYNDKYVPPWWWPLRQPPHLRGRIRNCDPLPPTNTPPPPQLHKSFFRHRKWVESTIYFPLYIFFYLLFPRPRRKLKWVDTDRGLLVAIAIVSVTPGGRLKGTIY